MVVGTESLPHICTSPITEWPASWPDTDMMDMNNATCDIILSQEDFQATILLSTSYMYNYSIGHETKLEINGYNLPCGTQSMAVSAYGLSSDSTCYVNTLPNGSMVKCQISCTCGENLCDFIAIRLKRQPQHGISDVIEICSIHEI